MQIGISARRIVTGAVTAFFLFSLIILPANAADNIALRLKGLILLDVQQHGEAWYVSTKDLTRLYLGRPDDAMQILRTEGLGITNQDLVKIPIGFLANTIDQDSDNDGLRDPLEDAIGTDKSKSDTDGDGFSDYTEVFNSFDPLSTNTSKLIFDQTLVTRLKGKILLQVQNHGEAWYVYPKDGKRYFMGSAESTYSAMRMLSLGITSADLAKIPQRIEPGVIIPPVAAPAPVSAPAPVYVPLPNSEIAIISTDPANGATNVFLNKRIAVTFNQPVNAPLITIKGPVLPITNPFGAAYGEGKDPYHSVSPSNVWYFDNFYDLDNKTLLSNSAYTATISAKGVKNNYGNEMKEDYSWSFTTGTSVIPDSPTIISSDPIGGAQGVALDKTISITFSNPMDPATINNSSVKLYKLQSGMADGIEVPGKVSYSGTSLYFDPYDLLEERATYSLKFTGEVKDLNGNFISGWLRKNNFIDPAYDGVGGTGFTTGPDTVQPTATQVFTGFDKPTNVNFILPSIKVSFSEIMNAGTINATTITLSKVGGPIVPGSISYEDSYAYIEPSVWLETGTNYVITVTTGAKDLSGLSLASNYTYTFSTIAVLWTNPNPNGGFDINATNENVKVNFGRAMNPSSINNSTFILTIQEGNIPVAGTITYDDVSFIATFAPNSSLPINKPIIVAITTGIQDAAGINIPSGYTWYFIKDH